MRQKILVAAMLLLSFASGSCLCGKAESAIPGTDLLFALSRPVGEEMFWKICDAVRSRVVAEAHPTLLTETKYSGSVLSISLYLVRR